MGLHNVCQTTYDSVEDGTNNFSEDNYVGKFQFGKVYRGKFHFGECYLGNLNGKAFIVKMYDDPNAKPGVIGRRLRDELDLLKFHEGVHPGLVKLLAYYWDEGKLGIVYDIDAVDSLRNLVTKDYFTWPQRIKAAVRLACFLDDINLPCSNPPHLPYVIRNLDAAHIIIDKDYNPLLYDYSMITGGELADRRDLIDQQVDGCAGYTDPNHCTHGGGNKKCDVFAFGVVLLTLISQIVYTEKDHSEALTPYNWVWSEYKKQIRVNRSKFSLVSPSIEAGELLTKSDGIKITRIALRCVDPNPSRRPSMSQVMAGLCNLQIVRQWEKTPGINMTLFDGFEYDPLESRLSGYLRSMEKVFHRSFHHVYKTTRKLRHLVQKNDLKEPNETMFSPLLSGKRDTVKVFSMSELRTYTNGFSNENLIGKCEFGKIYRGNIYGKMVTVKVWEYVKGWWDLFYGSYDNRIWDALDLLHHPRFRYHPNIATLIGYCFERRNDFAMVFDQEEITTVHDLLRDGTFTWVERITVILRLALVMEYIHHPNDLFRPCIVGNLHPTHLLIDKGKKNPILFNFSSFRGGFLPNRDLFRRDRARHLLDHPVHREWTQDIDVHLFGVCMMAIIMMREDNTDDPQDSRIGMVSVSEFVARGSFEQRPSLVDKTLTEHVGYSFEDGSELTALAIECIANEQGEVPSMRDVVKRLRKLKVVQKNNLILEYKNTNMIPLNFCNCVCH